MEKEEDGGKEGEKQGEREREEEEGRERRKEGERKRMNMNHSILLIFSAFKNLIQCLLSLFCANH